MISAPFRSFCLAASLISIGCQCAERNPYEADSTGTEPSTTAGLGSSTGAITSGTDTTNNPDNGNDAKFLAGVYHNENYFTPFGGEGPNGGGAILANVEFRADGTATMWVEECSVAGGTNVIHWRWTPLPGPWVELTPGEGEDSLRFFAWSDLQSLRATINDQCVMFFEPDGELFTSHTFRLGRACWVVRCEDDVTHVDYCEGEPIPACP